MLSLDQDKGPGDFNMFRSIAAGVAAAVCLTAGAASAEPFDTFGQFCLENEARPEAIESAVHKAGGWHPVPEEMIGPMRQAGFGQARAWMNAPMEALQDPDKVAAIEMVIAARVDGAAIFQLPGTTADICMVMAAGHEAGPLRRKLEGAMGFEAYEAHELPLWMFTPADGGGYRSENALATIQPEAFIRILAERPIHIASFMDDRERGLTGLLAGVLRANP